MDDGDQKFCDEVTAALKSDSNDLRKEARILKAHREAIAGLESRLEKLEFMLVV